MPPCVLLLFRISASGGSCQPVNCWNASAGSGVEVESAIVRSAGRNTTRRNPPTNNAATILSAVPGGDSISLGMLDCEANCCLCRITNCDLFVVRMMTNRSCVELCRFALGVGPNCSVWPGPCGISHGGWRLGCLVYTGLSSLSALARWRGAVDRRWGWIERGDRAWCAFCDGGRTTFSRACGAGLSRHAGGGRVGLQPICATR